MTVPVPAGAEAPKINITSIINSTIWTDKDLNDTIYYPLNQDHVTPIIPGPVAEPVKVI